MFWLGGGAAASDATESAPGRRVTPRGTDMRLRLRIAAGLAAAAALAVFPAAAQQKNFDIERVPYEIEEELFCLYDPLFDSDDYYEIEDVAFATDMSAEESQMRIEQALDPYSAVCERVYAWTDEQSDLAREFTLYLAVSDLIYDRLVNSDVSSSILDGIDDEIDFLPKEELAPFGSGEWKGDAAFRKKMEARLKGLGVPEQEGTMSLALEYMAWTIASGYAAVGFVNTFASPS